MKIEGPNRAQSTGATGKKGGVSRADGSFGGMVTGGAQESASTVASHSIAGLDTLLALQGAEDPAARATRGRMTKRAGGILEELDRMRLALLSGQLTVGHVIDIADVVASHREKIMDPHLTALLDEIDMRAQIEIAKLRKALENRV